MTNQYYSVLTDLGQQVITSAQQAGEIVTIRSMGFGDANMTYVDIETAKGLTALINMQSALMLSRGPQSDDYIGGGIDLTSTDFPGVWVYECGLFDENGNLIVYCMYPPSQIPDIADNVEKGISIDIGVILSNTDNVTVYVDPELEALTKAVADTLYFKLDQNFAEFEDDDHGDEAKAAARGHMGLGTVAPLDVTTSTTDNTTGHVLKVGDRGLAQTLINATGIDFDAYQFAAGETLFLKMANCTNIPDGIDTAVVVYAYANVIGVRDTKNNVGILIGESSGTKYYWAVRTTNTSGVTSWKVRILPQSAADISAVPQYSDVLTVDLNTLDGTKPGRYQQTMSVDATTAYHYPVNTAGSLDVIPNGTSLNGCTQEYRPYNNSVLYRRTYSISAGVWSWSGWAEEYSTVNPPPATDLSGYQKANTASKATNCWFKDTNTGIIIQKGYVPQVGSSTVTVNYPIAFNDTPAVVPAKVSTGAEHATTITAIGSTSFGIYTNDGYSPAYWIAMGY